MDKKRCEFFKTKITLPFGGIRRLRSTSFLAPSKNPSETGNVFFAMFGAVALVGALGFAAGSIMQGPMKTMAEVSQRAEAEGEIISNMQLLALSISDLADQDCDKDGTVEPPAWDAGTGPTGGGVLPATLKSSNLIDPWGTPYGYCAWDHGLKVEGDTAIGGECASGAQRLQGLDTTQHGAGIIAHQPTLALISAGPDRTFATTCRNWADADIDGGQNGNLLDAADLPLIEKSGDDLTLTFNYAEASVATSSQWRLKENTGDTAGDSVAEITDDKVELGGDNVQIGDAGGVDTGLLDLTAGGLTLPRDPGDDSVTGACVNAGLNDQQMRFNTSTIPSGLEICTGGAWTSMGGPTTAQICAPYTPNAVEFDGVNDSITTTTASIPDSKLWSGSVWIRKNVPAGDYRFYSEGNSDGTIFVQSSGAVRFNKKNTGGTTVLNCATGGGVVFDTNWHHVAWAFDMGNSLGEMYVDGVLQGSCAPADHTLTTNSSITVSAGATLFDGDVADLWMDFGSYIDFSSSAVRQKFINDDGTPVYLGADGGEPLGSTPDIFLSGSTDGWHSNKGTAAGFTETGALTTSSELMQAGTNCTGSGRGFCSAYNPNPVTFDGTNDYLIDNSASYSAVKRFSMSFWARKNSLGSMKRIFSSNAYDLDLRINGSNALYLNFKASGAGGALVFNTASNIINDTDWHHILISANLNGADSDNVHLYIDDSDIPITVSTIIDTPMEFDSSSIIIGDQNTANTWDGDLADFWVKFGSSIDFSNEENRRKFITSAGMPVYLGPTGSEQTLIAPHIYLTGSTDNWHTNKGTGTTFTENGALTTATTPPPEGDNCTTSGSGDIIGGLEDHWKLDETSGTTVANSASSRNGTYQRANPSSVKGVDGNAFYIDGEPNAYFDVVHDYNYSEHTVCGWYNYKDSGGLIGLLSFRGASNWGFFYRPSVNSFRIVDNISGGPGQIYTTQIPLNSWFHVCAGINDAQDNFLYINGTPAENDIAANGTLSDYVVTDLRVGNLSGSNKLEYAVDDVKIYSRALSENDVQTLYQSYNKFSGTLDTTDLVAHFKLDESSGANAINAVDNTTHPMQGGLDANTNNNSAGIDGGAIEFDGSNDYIDISGIPAFTGNNLTLSAWINLDQLKDYVGIIFYRDGVGGEAIGLNLGGNVYNNGELGYHWNGQEHYRFSSKLFVPIKEWVFVSVVIDPDKATLYLGDKVSLKNAVQETALISRTANAWYLGKDPHNTIREINGFMDDARIYHRSLSYDEIKNLYEVTGQNYLTGPQNNGQAITETFTTNQTITQNHSSDALLRDYGLIISKDTSQTSEEAAIGFLVKGSPAADDITGAGIGAIKDKIDYNSNALVFKTQNADENYNTRATINANGLGLGMGGPEHVYTALQIRGIMGDDWNGDFSLGLMVNGGRVTVVEENDSSYIRSTISASLRHVCAIKADQEIWCWGQDNVGQLGNGGVSGDQEDPVLITESGPWKHVTTGDQHTCGIKTDGTAWCWGYNTHGQLGIGSIGSSQNAPTQIDQPGPWVLISAGFQHTCGIKADGTAYCWGDDASGELGNGSVITASQGSPSQINDIGPWKHIDVGRSASCGIKTDGTAYCWGSDSQNMLGNGADGDQDSPDALSQAGPWTHIAIGHEVGCAVKADETGWCWGRKTFGAVGVGGGGTEENPVNIDDPSPWHIIDPGYRHTCGIKTDGGAYCWGSETNGELGNGVSGNTTTPQQITDTDQWNHISAHQHISCGTKNDGTAECWGSETDGELGNGAAVTADQADPYPLSDAGPWFVKTLSAAVSYTASALGYLGMNGTDNAESALLFGSKLIIAGVDTDGDNLSEIMRLDGSGLTTFSSQFVDMVDKNFISTSRSTTSGLSNVIAFQKSRGVENNKEALQVNDIIGALAFSGRNTTNITNDANAAIYAKVSGAPSAGNVPTEIHFSVDENGSATTTGSQMMITSDGKLAIGTTGATTNKVHIEGVAAYNNGLRFGNDTLCASGNDDGTIRYNSGGEILEYCQTNVWNALDVDSAGSLKTNPKQASVLIGWGSGALHALSQFDGGTSDLPTPTEIANIYGVAKASAGHGASCVLTNIGEIWCWGSQTNWGLGNSNNSGSQSTPEKLIHPSALKWRAVDLGIAGSIGLMGCAIDVINDAYCWGANTNGTQGTGSNNPTPSLVDGGHKWQSISAAKTSCGVTTAGDGYCWGDGFYGQIGDGANTDRSAPTAISGSHIWQHISSGEDFVCGITTAGEAYCWGDKEFGGMGDGTSTGTQNTPQRVPVGIKWKDISVTRDVCGITALDTMLCWGRLAGYSNTAGGQLVIAERPYPTPTGVGIKWQKVDTGYGHNCALSTEGKAYCWGDGDTGEVGDGLSTDRTEPQPVSSALRFKDISSGGGHNLAITDPQKSKVSYAVGWGADTNGIIGNDSVQTNTNIPRKVYGTNDFVKIDTNFNRVSCGIVQNRDMYCWGENSNGELGDGTTTDREQPTLVDGGYKWSDVDTLESITCGVTVNGVAYCWGNGSSNDGIIGNGTTGTDYSSPARVSGGHIFKQISVGGAVACGIIFNGDAYCWGTETNGQLGNGGGFTETMTRPTLVAGGYKYKKIAVSQNSICGLGTDGSAYCWGSDTNGALGNGGGVDADVGSPVAVTGGFSFIDIGGRTAFCGIDENHDAYCWGIGSSGQMGDGTTLSTRDEPTTMVSGNHKWKKIDGASSSLCGITLTNDVYCWGRGSFGQMGNATNTATNSTPVSVLLQTKAVDISAKGTAFAIIRNHDYDGLAKCDAGEVVFADLYTSTNNATLTTDEIEISGVNGSCDLSIASDSANTTIYLNTVAQTGNVVSVENGDLIYLDIEAGAGNSEITTYINIGNKQVEHKTYNKAKIVFVSSTGKNGNKGGLTGADQICQGLASDSGLNNIYKAWISDDTGFPVARFSHWDYEYRLVTGAKVSDNWSDLTDGSLDTNINVLENGTNVPSGIDTNTTPAGFPKGSNHCSNWSANIGTRHSGQTSQNDTQWTDFSTNTCSNGAPRMYCFEQ